MFRFKRTSLTTTQIIAYGFLAAILIGTILLSLPIAASNGQRTPLIDAMFTATTSICVTGLTTVSTANHWSVFGKVVIAILMQFGGLGIVTFTTTLLLMFKKRITLKERILIQDAYNLDTIRGMVRLTKRIVKDTLIVEGIGALFYCIIFIPKYNFVEGVGKAVFLSISAFCNAGMDLLGDSSLSMYRGNWLINVVTMSLIILGGIGFPVWWDMLRICRMKRSDNISFRNSIHKFSLHTKLVISITAILIFGGAFLILVIEWGNTDTLGNLPWWEKGLAALFQSVTLRTAGFFTISQEKFTNASSVIFLLMMFIGGSPSGTAGGVKTVTFGLLILAAMTVVKGKEDTEAFNRKISSYFVKKGLAVVLISGCFLVISMMALSLVENAPFLDVLYETTSAIATVGLTRGLTGELSVFGKLIIIATMYAGRIGPISLALFFNSRKVKSNTRKLPVERIIVG